jgi:hypothetical protein
MTESGGGKRKTGIYVTITLVVVLILAGSVYVYVNFLAPRSETPTNGETSDNGEAPGETVLTVYVAGSSWNYSMTDLLGLEAYTGENTRINTIGKISGPYSYTGVPMPTLLETVEPLPENYTLQVIANDNNTLNFTMSEVNGHVPIYDSEGNETGVGNLTMLIAYEEGDVMLNQSTGGPLRIVFVDQEGSLTKSSNSLKYLIEIRIIET